MAFSEQTVMEAWERAGAQCECTRKTCGHESRCAKKLKWENRGKEGLPGAWEAHHISAQSLGGSDNVSNCEILCLKCHKNTKSYGRH